MAIIYIAPTLVYECRGSKLQPNQLNSWIYQKNSMETLYRDVAALWVDIVLTRILHIYMEGWIYQMFLQGISLIGM